MHPDIRTIKINITDHCGARCTTCRQHLCQPKRTMTPWLFEEILDRVYGQSRDLFINGTGDYLCLENHQAYSDVLLEFLRKRPAPPAPPMVSVTHNGNTYGRAGIYAHMIVCSLNAVDPDAFDEHIGIPGGLDRVVRNIQQIIADHRHVEVHSLKWAGNPDPARRLMELFGTEVPIRISEKVENQGQTRVDEPRVPCDYLDGLTINPDGNIRLCAHDFDSHHILGHVNDLEAAVAERNTVRERHRRGEFTGLCRHCNYNVATPRRIYYITGPRAGQYV